MSVWPFESDFAAGAFGWRADKKAATRLRAAVAVLQKHHKLNPEEAAEGAICLIERLWPATQQVNRAAGELDDALARAAGPLKEILSCVRLTDGQLDRLVAAFRADFGDLLDPYAAYFGVLCSTQARAKAYANALLGAVRHRWLESVTARCPEAVPCLSALVAAGQGKQALAMLSVGGPKCWSVRRFGAQATAKADGHAAALAYAEASTVPSHLVGDHARFCEAHLLAAGQPKDAFDRYALAATSGHTRLARHTALAKKYPKLDPSLILETLITSEPSAPGKYFATAHHLGLFDRALALAEASPPDPKVLIRAAQKHVEDAPEFAFGAASAAARWVARGRVYKLTPTLLNGLASSLVATAVASGSGPALETLLVELSALKNGPALVKAVGALPTE